MEKAQIPMLGYDVATQSPGLLNFMEALNIEKEQIFNIHMSPAEHKILN